MEAISQCEVELCVKRPVSHCNCLNCKVVARKPWMANRAGDNLIRMRCDTSNGVCVTQRCTNKDHTGCPAKVMPHTVGLMQLQITRVSLQLLPATASSNQSRPLIRPPLFRQLQACAFTLLEVMAVLGKTMPMTVIQSILPTNAHVSSRIPQRLQAYANLLLGAAADKRLQACTPLSRWLPAYASLPPWPSS